VNSLAFGLNEKHVFVFAHALFIVPPHINAVCLFVGTAEKNAIANGIGVAGIQLCSTVE
jgi:hypothetical protein